MLYRAVSVQETRANSANLTLIYLNAENWNIFNIPKSGSSSVQSEKHLP